MEIDSDMLLGLASHLNPTVTYLCQEIQGSDQSFSDF